MFDLEGRRAVVTGGSRGIGQGIAIALAEAGADVASIHLPDPEFAPITQSEVMNAGRQCIMVEGDVSDARQVDDFARHVHQKWGGIDIWVNNASRLMLRPFLEMSDEEWYGLMGSNLFGYYNGCRSALRIMVPQRRGNIVNISSVTASQPINEAVAYVTAKGGVVGLTRALAIEFGSQGIIINAVAPGATETPLTKDVYTPEVRASYEARIAVARLAKPRDIADAVLFLCSDAARYVSGHELLVDGGLVINGNVGMRAS